MSELDEKLLNRVKDELIKEGYLHIHGIEKFWPEVCRRYAEEVYRPDFELVDKHIGELEQEISQLKLEVKEKPDSEISRDWTEDFTHENGNYLNKCIECGEQFKGHKRRVICKECFTPNWAELAKKTPPEDNKCAHAGCWADGEMTGFARCMVKEVFPRDAAIAERDKELVEAYRQLTIKKQQLSERGEKIKQLEEKIYGRQDGEMHDFGCQCFKCIISRFEREIERLKQSRIASIKASLEKAAKNAKLDDGVPENDYVSYSVDESSITSESNIVIVE